MPQSELTPEGLATTLAALTARADLIEMSERGRAVARLDAVPRMVAACEQLALHAGGGAA